MTSIDPGRRFVSHPSDKRKAHDNLQAQGAPQWSPEHLKPEAQCAYCGHAGAEHPGFETNPMLALSCTGIDNNGDPCRCKGWCAKVIERQHERLIQSGFVVVRGEDPPDVRFVQPEQVDPVGPEEWVYCGVCGAPGHPKIVTRVTSGWRRGVRGVWEGVLYCPACVPVVLMSIPQPHDPPPLVDEFTL